jgi:hypothetical protein
MCRRRNEDGSCRQLNRGVHLWRKAGRSTFPDCMQQSGWQKRGNKVGICEKDRMTGLKQTPKLEMELREIWLLYGQEN